jgi:hypothetical protein
MRFTKSGGNTAQGPTDWFTGDVLIDTVRNPDNDTAIGCAHVRFVPGARIATRSAYGPASPGDCPRNGTSLCQAVAVREVPFTS